MSDVLIGVTLPQFTDDPDVFASSAARAESLGLDSIWVFDHLWPLSGGKDRPVIECGTALAWIASATSSVGVGTLVARSSLRHPAVLAQTAAAVAAIAPGRLTLGIGSGDEMSRAENEAYGIPYYAGADRIDQLESAVRVLAGALREGRVTVHDDFNSVESLPATPRPDPPPALWVGGRSDDALEVAGSHGDGWNGWGGTPERFAQDALRATEFASDAGREIELTWGGEVVLGSDDEEAAGKLKNKKGKSAVGGPDAIARHIDALVSAGARHVVLTFNDSGRPGSYELLAERVKPLLGV